MNDNVISHYKIIDKISQGALSDVYKAVDLSLDRIVVLKFLPSNLTDSLQKNRFINEAKALANLNHPNVATIFGIEESKTKSFIVMEFVEGCNLRKVLIDYGSEMGYYNMPIDKILQFTIQIVRGLYAAHQKQIIHRDIKPENIMIGPEEHLKILDFGVAKISGKEQVTKIGTTVGTIAYMSPEQSLGQPVDHHTDIWSLGVVLYEMITGIRPFKGDYDQAIIYSILNENPDPLEIYRPDVPENLRNIVYKAISKKPGDRYENCEELLKDLQSCLLTLNPEKNIDIYNELTDNNSTIIPLEKKRRNINWFIRSFKKRIRIAWSIILSLIILIAISIYIFRSEFNYTNLHGEKIAVLPFINMSKDVNDEYFSDGIMEDILTQLVKVSNLKVISRTTMMHYKNSDKNLKQISNELNADVVLEGSVRHYADKFRISVQLINAKTDEHIWAESYDRNLKDIFLIQSQIAYQIAGTLQAKLSLGEKEQLDKISSISPEAYNAYSQGRFFLEQRNRGNIDNAINYFNQAIRFDSNYAQAWVGLAKAHCTQADMGIIPLEEGYHTAKIEVEKALKIDTNLAEAYARLAWIKMTYDWDWNGADADYKMALRIEPGNAAIIQSAGVLAAVLGHLDEAIELSQRAIELNPILSTPYYNLGLHFYYAHRWEKAKATVLKVLELNPQYPAAHTLLGRIYLAESKPNEALSEVQNETEIVWRKFGIILVYHAMGKKTEANTALKEFTKEYQGESAYQIAEIYAFSKDLDNAFFWLERAYQQRDGGLGDMKGDPLMDNIAKDPRYAVFMKKMNL